MLFVYSAGVAVSGESMSIGQTRMVYPIAPSFYIYRLLSRLSRFFTRDHCFDVDRYIVDEKWENVYKSHILCQANVHALRGV